MYIMLGKACSSLAPTPSKHDTNRIQDGGLSGIVWTDENICIPQLNG
jgi:hypothetical protein